MNKWHKIGTHKGLIIKAQDKLEADDWYPVAVWKNGKELYSGTTTESESVVLKQIKEWINTHHTQGINHGR